MAEADQVHGDQELSLDRSEVEGYDELALISSGELDEIDDLNLNEKIDEIRGYMESNGYEAIISISDTGFTLYREKTVTSFRTEGKYSPADLAEELDPDSLREGLIDHLLEEASP